jgi:hypothetical protein
VEAPPSPSRWDVTCKRGATEQQDKEIEKHKNDNKTKNRNIMRKIAVILSVIAFIAGGCGQGNTKKQTETITEDTLTTVNNTDLHDVQNMNDNQLFDIQKIDSVKYFALKGKTNITKTNWERITDLKQAKKRLKGRVIWGNDNEGKFLEDEQGDWVYKIVFRNGKTYSEDYPEVGFIAYYPQEDILLLEGGHTTDVSFNLTTGEETEDVGNPEYIIFSPSKLYRFNGHFGGQECSNYFIQQKIDGHYRKIFQLNSTYEQEKSEFEKRAGIWLCRIIDAFWQSDTVLNFITVVPDETGLQEIKLYYQLVLK